MIASREYDIHEKYAGSIIGIVDWPKLMGSLNQKEPYDEDNVKRLFHV